VLESNTQGPVRVGKNTNYNSKKTTQDKKTIIILIIISYVLSSMLSAPLEAA
jgi:hypothetical protein